MKKWILAMDKNIYAHYFLVEADLKEAAFEKALQNYVRMFPETKIPGGLTTQSILREGFVFSIKPCPKLTNGVLCMNPRDNKAITIYPNMPSPENDAFRSIVKKVASS